MKIMAITNVRLHPSCTAVFRFVNRMVLKASVQKKAIGERIRDLSVYAIELGHAVRVMMT